MRTNCDICGKQFQSFIPEYEIHEYEDLCPGRVKRTKILELCHDCHDELKKFIKREET